MLASLLGCMDAGAIATPVNHRWSAPELMLAMQLTQPALAIVDQHCHELVQQACNSLPAAMRLATVSMEHFHAPCGLPVPGGSAACSPHAPETTCGPSQDPATGLQLLTAPGGTCLLCFTSGTTGQPKAVALTHASLNHASLAKLAAVGYSQTDTYLHLAPLFHVGAISSALACLMAGAAHVLLPRFNPHHALHLMQEHGVTAFIAVPAIMQDLVRAAASAPAAASCPPSCVASRPAYPPSPSPIPPITPMLTVRLILLGAGATTPQLQAELFRVFPAARVMSAYGITEASSSITFLSITSPCKHGQLHSVQPCSYAHQPSQAQPGDGTAQHHHQLQGQLITTSPNLKPQQHHQTRQCKDEQQQQQQRLPASAPNVKGIYPANTCCKQLPVNLSGAVRVGWPSPGVAVRICPFPDVELPDSSSGSSSTANSQSVDRCGSSSSSQGAGRMVAAAAPWQEGEVWTRSAQVMQGYWGDSQATRQQVLTPSGWLSTGDVGFLDPTGCLWLRGRAKDMIKTGGENVFAAEVEAALVSHPSVKAAAVVGIPDARLGETVAALLVLQPGWQWKGHTAGLPGAAATEELEEAMSSRHVINSSDVQDHCRNVVQLSPYKLPRVIVALAPNVELPCTTSGKVMKDPVKAAVLAARANPLSKL
ncbi:hypothetical protein QJQ45_007871 [Haematococcus lacustris]|nr:hypothetical protein QJQ45_007871 [Haematococcus lacustris]